MGILIQDPPAGPLLSSTDGDGFVEVVGERVALLGNERGHFEVWMWPLCLFTDLGFSVRLEGEPVDLGRCERTVRVVPEGLGIAWRGEGLALDLEVFASRTRRRLVFLLSSDGSPDLEVELTFRPAFQPMWPAGLGGKISGPDEDTGAFLMTEELGRFAALIGSPDAEPLEAPGDRGMAGEVTLRLPLEASREEPLPVFLAGAQLEAEPLSDEARRGGGQSACGTARSDAVVAVAREAYRALEQGWREELHEQREHWRSFLQRTARLETDDEDLDSAFLWSKIAIERCWVTVDGIGRTLVAGLGPSVGGERPGYAWFFNGDALVGSRALTGLGEYESCRQILRTAAGTQREDGKISHEISLSAGLCDWFGDYPYAYYKGQVTPGFVSCLAHYVSASGDDELARELWPNVLRAMEWSASTTDDEGRMQVPLAGIAAVEAGPLAGEIQSEIYLQGIWISALDGALALAERLGEPRDAWQALLESAHLGLETFWNEDLERYGFAHLRDGGRCDDHTVYSALPLSRPQPLYPGRKARSAEKLTDPRLATDWGLRMFAEDSEFYDPEHYNTGSVFPYLTNFAVLALFRHGLPLEGWSVLRSQVALDGIGGLGYLPEFLAGDSARLLPRSVPHQVFSQTTILQGVLFGVLGIEYGPGGKAFVRPWLPPDLDRLALRDLPLLGRRWELELTRTEDRPREIRLQLATTEGVILESEFFKNGALTLEFTPGEGPDLAFRIELHQ